MTQLLCLFLSTCLFFQLLLLTPRHSLSLCLMALLTHGFCFLSPFSSLLHLPNADPPWMFHTQTLQERRKCVPLVPGFTTGHQTPSQATRLQALSIPVELAGLHGKNTRLIYLYGTSHKELLWRFSGEKSETGWVPEKACTCVIISVWN